MECRSAVERFVYYRLPTKEDGEDVIQEVCLTACQRYGTLQDRACFKAWLLRIAQNKCRDFYRAKAKKAEIPLEAISENALTDGRFGLTETDAVRETLDLLSARSKQVLYLYYFQELTLEEVSKKLSIPLGTVKSRLYNAKQSFKSKYPSLSKGECFMKELPEYLPAYTITPKEEPAFPVVWEELLGWFLIPKLGQHVCWGLYEAPSGKCAQTYTMQVIGPAEVHGVEGVEITAAETVFPQREDLTRRTFVAQVTDTHCRYLATTWTHNGIRKYSTFLDGDAFLPSWGYGEDNCGRETHLKPKGKIRREGNHIASAAEPFLLDIVGRYEVKMDEKTYDTVCVIDIEKDCAGAISEQYLDRNGRTILWRRFNRNDWAFDHYQQYWTEQLPDNERLDVNGKVYVHWYDCITDYIF